MKFPTKEELNEYTWAIGVGAAQGATIGAGVSFFLNRLVNKRFPAFKTMGAFPKTFLTIFPVIMIGVTSMEHASRKFERVKYGYIDEYQEEMKRRRASESPSGRVLDWLNTNKYPTIGVAWAACMGGSFWAINRDKLMTRSQKIVQARMYAQGLTVILLIASMALSMAEDGATTKFKPKEEWESVVDEEVQRENAAHLPLHLKDRVKKEDTNVEA